MTQTVEPAKRKRADKLVDALSASSLIAFFSQMEFSSGLLKATCLCLSPWLALLGNAVIAVIGIYVGGFARIYLDRPLANVFRTAAEGVLRDDDAPSADKDAARKTLEKLRDENLKIFEDMRTRISEVFAR